MIPAITANESVIKKGERIKIDKTKKTDSDIPKNICDLLFIHKLYLQKNYSGSLIIFLDHKKNICLNHKSFCTFSQIMKKGLIIPASIMDSFHKAQENLGGNFKRQTKLDPRIHSAASYVVDRINNEESITRIKLVSPGFILNHKHHEVDERYTILHLSDGAYGHLFLPSHHRLNIEKIVDQPILFKKGELHGLSVLSGFAIVKVEIFGNFSPEDIHIH